MNQRGSSPKIMEKLGYSVYLYIDPRDSTIFYGAKGQGNRAFSHLSDASESRKVAKIREIHDAGLEPSIDILVHSLPDEMIALRIEASVIYLLGLDILTNQVLGWQSGVVGRLPVKAMAALTGCVQ